MNSTLLQRCLDELSADNVRLDYIRGILETLIALGESSNGRAADFGPANLGSIPSSPAKHVPVTPTSPDEPLDEGKILEQQTRARINLVRELSEKSTELA